jgi:RNA polymerase sigma-70 factor, ECF subfamily
LIAIAPRVTTPTLPEEFERIYCEHSKFIYRTAYRITGNSEDAEDAMQTLFLRILRRELPADFSRNPKAYLYRAAVNIALNIVRARKSSPLSDSCCPDPVSTEETRGEAEIRQRLLRAMADLRPRAAEILILRHVHGYSDAEIAEFLGTSRGTIAVSLFRSRARLRKSIRALLGDKP